ncbi:MAG: restriction endonuclease [Pseudomonadota bacterium]
MPKQSVELEKLVQRIQQQLAPQAAVLHDVRLMGRHSKRSRQIDVLVREQIGQYEINIIIDCKDYNKPVDVKGVEEFYGLIDDVGAHRGVLVCPKGFSDAAKARATGYQIDLFSPIDTEVHKWQVKPTIPAICDFRIAAFRFGISCCAPLPFTMKMNFYKSLVAYDEAGTELGVPFNHTIQRWNDGNLTDEIGETKDIHVFGIDPVYVDNGYGIRAPVSITTDVVTTQQLYAGELPVSKLSGFRDEQKGHVITNAFEIGLLDPEKIEREWTKIESEDEADPKPLIALRGVVAWDM